MKAITYRLSDGEITGIHVNNGVAVRYDAEAEGVIYGALADPAINYIDTETNRILTRDAGQRPATWEQIEAKRDALRESPIVVDSGLTFHADEDSFVLFENSIKHFNDLEELDENRKLGWKDANKTYHPHSKEELTALRDELSLKRAKRASKLQVRAEELNAAGCTVADIEDLTNWGL